MSTRVEDNHLVQVRAEALRQEINHHKMAVVCRQFANGAKSADQGASYAAIASSRCRIIVEPSCRLMILACHAAARRKPQYTQ
jgi:hypothetical protein